MRCARIFSRAGLTFFRSTAAKTRPFAASGLHQGRFRKLRRDKSTFPRRTRMPPSVHQFADSGSADHLNGDEGELIMRINRKAILFAAAATTVSSIALGVDRTWDGFSSNN